MEDPDLTITLNSEQIDAIKRALELRKANQIRAIFVTGPAGCGKSLLVEGLSQELNTLGEKALLVAPTAKAALKIDGKTIHSAFGLGPHFQGSVDLLREDPPRARAEDLANITYLIIDEISMVTADLFTAMDYAMRHAQGTNIPFGGVPLVIFGDFGQLPPIQPQYPVDYPYQTPYPFSSPSWRETLSQGVEYSPNEIALKTVHRKDPNADRFIEILEQIRLGSCGCKEIAYINRSATIDSSTGTPQELLKQDCLTLTTTRRLAEKFNNAALDVLPGENHIFRSAVFRRDQSRLKDLPIEYILRLKTGCKVLITKNIPELGVTNGDQATVERIEKDRIIVRTDNTNQIVDIERVYMDVIDAFEHLNENDRRVLTKEKTLLVRQFPLLPGYAMTIHRAQGQTLDKCRIILPARGKGTFAHGQLYVALSRVRSAADLILNRALRPEDFVFDTRVCPYLGLGLKQQGGKRKGAGRKPKFPGSMGTISISAPSEIAQEAERFIRDRWEELQLLKPL